MDFLDSLCCGVGLKYEQYNWGDLPDEAKEAALSLGYDRKMWDAEKEPSDISDVDWEALNPDQQAAAGVLGYDKRIWEKRQLDLDVGCTHPARFRHNRGAKNPKRKRSKRGAKSRGSQ